MSLQYTQLVRDTIRKHRKGYTTMYTNKYKHCRTVKCYGGEKNKKLCRKIDEALIAVGSVGHSVNILKSKCPFYGYVNKSIIVRLPN
jgi:hypothetical protein